MGSLAHTANMRHGANTANKQGAPHSGMPQPGPPPPQASALMRAHPQCDELNASLVT